MERSGRGELYMSSKQWLARHGLKAKKIGFYDFLQTLAFKHCDGVVDIQHPPKGDVGNAVRVVLKYCACSTEIFFFYRYLELAHIVHSFIIYHCIFFSIFVCLFSMILLFPSMVECFLMYIVRSEAKEICLWGVQTQFANK